MMKMPEKNPELDPRIKSRLEELKPDSPRDPRRAAQTRAKFLAQVEAARKVLVQLGVRGARMSGSGSSVFGFVGSHEEGEAALRRLRGYPWKGFLTSCHG